MSYSRVTGSCIISVVGLVAISSTTAAQTGTQSVERASGVQRRPTIDLQVPDTATRAGPSIDLSGLAALEGLRLRALEGLEALDGLEALGGLASLEALEALKELDIEALETELREQLDAVRTAAVESALAEMTIPEAGGSFERSPVNHVTGDIAGLLAAFVAMCSLGFGLVFFAPRQLEVVADTVRHSFWRSFLPVFSLNR